jgi:hypothetical protein
MGICLSKKIIPVKVDKLDKKNISVNILKTIDKVNRQKVSEEDVIINSKKKNQKKKKNKKKTIPKTLKRLVWDTYVGPTIGETFCFCCKHQKIRQIEFQCGHVEAESLGGDTTVENLRPICAQCNISMGTMNLLDFKEKFFKIKK